MNVPLRDTRKGCRESRLNHKLVYKDARVSLLPQHLVAIYPKTKKDEEIIEQFIQNHSKSLLAIQIGLKENTDYINSLFHAKRARANNSANEYWKLILNKNYTKQKPENKLI